MADEHPFPDYMITALSGKILFLINSNKLYEEIIVEIVLAVKKATSFSSVGLRLMDGLDFPYYFTSGFDNDFVEKEMYLCAHDQAGELIRDSKGNPKLECMCGNVIAGRTVAKFPFFTNGGSFWSNCTSDLLASTTDEDRQTKTRDRCNGEGYESVGLFPVKAGSETYGLLQLNDFRKGMFSVSNIQVFENIAMVIGLCFSMIQVQKHVKQKRDDVIRLASVRTTLLEKIAESIKDSGVREEDELLRTSTLEKLDSIMEELETLKGILPICCYCKKIRDDTGYWEELEKYMYDRSKADFTHTYCPECYKRVMKDLESA